MTVDPLRTNLADVGEPRPRPGQRTMFAATFAVVAAAHLLVLVRLPAPAAPTPLAARTPVLSIDLAPLIASTGPRPPDPAPPTPAEAVPDPAPATPAAAPSAPAATPDPPAKPDINALAPPPLDLTAEPIQFAPAPSATARAEPDATLPSATDAGATCDLTATVQAALQANETVRNDLAAIPRASRSVANAVQLWNGVWVDARGIGGAAIIEPIRAAIVAIVDQAPPGCHDQRVAGPRLLTIQDPRGTVIVALGSDIWRWSDLSSPPSEPPLSK